MTRQEAAAYLPWLSETKHSMCRRAPWHDYSAPGVYMLTVVVKGRKPLLGSLKVVPYPHIEYSLLGQAIDTQGFIKMREVYPMIEVWKTCIMPDHIHMIIYVHAPLPTGKHLGHVIGGFKGGCTRLWWSMTGYCPTDKSERKGNPLFEDNYNDRLLFKNEQLNVWKKYLIDNPRRLALKRQNPHLFTTLHQYSINGRSCNIYGNRFLLDIPDKMAVIVHRADTEADYKAKCDQWLACGERGGVLVSASVAIREKAVMRIAMERGYHLILLRENGFPKIYKPSGESFDACANGRLLQVSPWEYHFDSRKITRDQCLELNAIAESIAQFQNFSEQA